MNKVEIPHKRCWSIRFPKVTPVDDPGEPKVTTIKICCDRQPAVCGDAEKAAITAIKKILNWYVDSGMHFPHGKCNALLQRH